MKIFSRQINIFTMSFYYDGRWIYVGEAHAGRVKRPKSHIDEKRAKKKPRKTQYRHTADWDEDCVHSSENDLVPYVVKFVKKHKRNPTMDDIGKIFADMQIESIYESHASLEKELVDWQFVQETFHRVILDIKGKKMIPDSAIGFLESLFFTIWLLPSTRNNTDVIMLLLLFVKGAMAPGESLTRLISEFLHATLSGDSFSASGVGSNQYEAHSSWEGVALLNSWRSRLHNPIFTKISFIISFLVTAGFVKEKCYSIGAFKVFQAEAFKEHVKCSDVVDGVLSTIVFFFEKGYQCFAERSLSPLWGSSSELNDFDDQMAFLVSHISDVRNGNLELRTGKTDNYYEDILERARDKVKMLIMEAPNATIKSIMLQKQIVLTKLYSDFNDYVASSGMREAPFCFCLLGKSSVGKSSLCPTLMAALLQVNGFECSDDFIVNVQENDKFMSRYKSKATGVVLDDMCNTRAEKAQVNPTARIIEIMNNVTTYANMAEADRKGKTFIMPKIVAITTNNSNLDAAFWSVEPVSVLRRVNCRIVVRVKPMYASYGKLDSGKVLLHYPKDKQADLIKDLWLLDLEYLEPIACLNNESGAENWRWTTFVDESGRVLKDVDVFTAIQFLGKRTQKHFHEQRKLVETYTNFGTKIQMCKDCCKETRSCTCSVSVNARDKMEAHSGVIWPVVKWQCSQYVSSMVTRWNVFLWSDLLGSIFPTDNEWYLLKKWSDAQLYMRAQRLSFSPFIWWTQLIPDDLVNKKWFRKFYFWISRKNRLYYLRNMWVASQCLGLTVVAQSSESNATAIKNCIAAFIPMGLLNFSISSALSHRRIVRELQNRRAATDLYTQLSSYSSTIAHVLRVGVYASFGAAAFATVRAIWREYQNRSASTPHSALNPSDDCEVDQRNAAINPWQQQPMPRPINIGTPASYVAKDMAMVVAKNLVYLSYREPGLDHRWCTGAIYISSNVIMMPRHVWFLDGNLSISPRKELVFDIVRAEKNENGGWCAKNVTMYYESGARVGDSDLMIFSLYVGGVRPSIIKFLPDERPNTMYDAHCVYRDKDGAIKETKGEFISGDASYVNKFGTTVKIDGGRVIYNIPTYQGMCITTLVARHNPPFILGFHLAGLTGTAYGSAVSVTKDDIKKAYALLKLTPGFADAHSSGEMPIRILGREIGFSPIISLRSPISYIYEYNADVYGSCSGGVKAGSKIKNSMIADVLTQKFGIEQKWGPPDFIQEGRRWKPWYDSMIHMVNPRHKVNPVLLELARKDYVNGFLPLFKLTSLTKYLRPLTLDETVNGIPGVRFIDAMNMRTSMGFPLSGVKSDYLVERDPPANADGNIIRKFDPTLGLEREMAECEARYLNGERCHPIFKACLKDEPTKKTKKKVRVFEAAPIVLQLLIRKYFLPIIRFVSMAPVTSECAVGINCFGTEWAELHEHVTSFGVDRIVAGDYSKWDLRLPAHLVLVAFDVLIRLAHLSQNYTESDMEIMRGIATDVAYPVIAFNGTLMELHGSNPSGQNLTAHLNSICNSLLLRMGFFSLTGKTSRFREFVHAFTYGDDLISGVDPGIEVFNHVTYAQFLREMDIEFTMPDKESDPVPYMHISDVDFLKRKSVFHTELLRYVGKLDLDSINKSLMCQRQGPKNLEATAMKSTIQSALHEVVLHGEEVYIKYAAMLQVATSDAGIFVPDLAIPYHHRIAAWFMKYSPDVDLSFIRSDIKDRILELKATGEVPVVGSLPDNVITVCDEIL